MDYYRNFDCLYWYEDATTITGIQYRVVTDLATEPVDIDFFKAHARIDFDTDDNLVEAYIKAARIELEQYTQKSFGVKTIGFRAREIPDNYRLMFGPVDEVTDPLATYTTFGDLISPGGENIEIEYTTLGIINETIRIAICRYAAGLYIWRENLIETKYRYEALMDEAKIMLNSYKNETWL